MRVVKLHKCESYFHAALLAHEFSFHTHVCDVITHFS